MNITEAGRNLAAILARCQADYIEAHLEESQSSHIAYRGKVLESMDKTSAVGGNIRALVNGGWGFVSFNSLENLQSKTDQAIEQARLVGGGEVKMEPVKPVVDNVTGEVKQNPVNIPLARKKQLLDEYNAVIWSTPKLQTSVIGYSDGYRKYLYLNSAGSYIEQERADVTLRTNAIATDNGEVQQSGLSLGSRGDFSQMEGLQQQIKENARRALDMLSAPHAKGGEYTVVLDPILAGVFIHEAFGHLSEADHVYENPQLSEIMTLGKKFGSNQLNVVDGAAVAGLRGSYKYDDEGVPAEKTYLIREGVLTGRLHSRETAARMKEKLSGNARAISYRFPPIVRMTNTYVEEPGTTSFNDMISDIKEGIYVKNWYGGTTSMEMFTFSAGEAYFIRNGKIAETLRPVVLTGNVFSTLMNIDAIGNDLDMNQGGGCGKGGQITFAGLEWQSAHQNSALLDWRPLMEEILRLAAKVAEAAEVFWISTEETPVHFQANRLKTIQSKQSTSVSLRIIKNGRLGYAAASGEIESRELVDIAVETAHFGMQARFDFPSATAFPPVEIFDPEVEKVPISEMIELGQKLIDPVLKSTPGIICEAGISKDVVHMKLINSRGGQAEYRKSLFGLGVGGTLIRDTDMLFVGEGKESCRPLKNTRELTDVVLRQLELCKNLAVAPTRQLPVIFTPDGAVSAFLPSLMSAFSGKTVLEGASPIGQRLGETVFDAKLSLFDDPTIHFAPNSRPCDDEGVPSRCTPLIEEGVVRNFLYDLQTAGQACVKSTGNGNRGRGGIMVPSPSAFSISAGQATFEEMVRDIKEGLIVEQLMGAEQGNILGGDFSGNVLLGYKIENGKITGRVKNTMVSGNVYQVLKNIVALGKEARWVGGSVRIPHIYCPGVAVASK